MRSSALKLACLVIALAQLSAPAASGQTDWDPNAVAYKGPTDWQRAAAMVLNRHLPTDSGFWVLGPLDLDADLVDTLNLVRTSMRILAPDPRGSESVTRRLWLPTGGVAFEELQPSDTLAHELPPGYPGRFLKGKLAGEQVFVQVLTVQEHRWLLWAERVQVAGITRGFGGPVARYSAAVTRYLAAVDSGRSSSRAPRAADYGLESLYDLYAPPPDPVIRDPEGFTQLLEDHRMFALDESVRNVYGLMPGPPLVTRLEALADSVLFLNKDGEVALQHHYRDFRRSGRRWSGYPILTADRLGSLGPGRYIYAVDRYGVIRLSPATATQPTGAEMTAALLCHGEPVRAAGEMVLAAEPGGPLRVAEVNIHSEEYFFSNRSLTLYDDVAERSDRYVIALAHVLRELERARLPVDGVLIRKY